ncbi:beta-lactamase/transpeptidase-like protein [Gymnopilus junonius]|uniref:Beta-lactamase/transpeptidase-like protein n=1 Tax=Gymnopilus junonius TaxID=109634 RepID=A0A9P5NC76_GYMJU|nr:beta-lactamase/transpeptidase-like protein [Gymnopilus junonius]
MARLPHLLKYVPFFCVVYVAGYHSLLSHLRFPYWLPHLFPFIPAWLLHSEPVHPICRPFFPPLAELSRGTNYTENYHIRRAARKLDAMLKELADIQWVDSLSVAVVTADGPVFSKGYGVRRANETDERLRGDVDENTVYRIASVSKLFTALELWILKEKGMIRWDDDITNYIPYFKYSPGGWASRGRSHSLSNNPHFPPHRPHESITLQQVASHMSGIPRDFPPALLADWPRSMEGSGLPHYNRRRSPSKREILTALSTHPLTVVPGSPPLYSNTGYALLGMAALTAHRYRGGHARTFEELLSMDVFRKLKMNSTAYAVTTRDLDLKDRVAVASQDSWEVDVDVGTMNPSYGQLSSLADLTKAMQMFLEPNRPDALISPQSSREWLRQSYAWSDDKTEVGLLWEIIKIADSYGRQQRVYQKLGEFMGHYSGFAFNPISSFGVVVLMTGSYSDSQRVVLRAFELFQKAFDMVHEEVAREMYAGTWRLKASDQGILASCLGRQSERGGLDENLDTFLVISVDDGSLWVDQFVLHGYDILAVLRDDVPEKVALVSTGRVGEFRLAKGYRPYSGKAHYGCMPLWVINDPGYSGCDAPVDIVYFVEHPDGRTLEIPSSRVSLERLTD